MECSKCAYPNIEGLTNCTNCGNDLTKAIVVTKNDYVKVIPQEEVSQTQNQNQNSHGTSQLPTINQSQGQNELDLHKTVTDSEYNLYTTGKPVKEDFLIDSNSSMLKPLYLKSEVSQYNPIVFKDDLTLVRGNCDPGDTSISSQPHARIARVDGRWMLENLASNKAVFVQVNGAVELAKGTVLLIGADKFYEFLPKNEEEE